MAPRRRPREGVAEQVNRQESGDAPPPQQTQPLPQDAHSGIAPPSPPPQVAQGFDMTRFLEGMAQFVAQHRDAPDAECDSVLCVLLVVVLSRSPWSPFSTARVKRRRKTGRGPDARESVCSVHTTMAPRRRPREGVAEQVTRQEAGDAPPPQQTQPLPQDAHSGIAPPPPPPQSPRTFTSYPSELVSWVSGSEFGLLVVTGNADSGSLQTVCRHSQWSCRH
ncbi:hypothetical protein Taro_014558 [Colocasia esculenta]|uniref:Uncharacterized protein n=1 Tax=Colocasia esculenta TaxID=4460 RepID=A0A843UF34_COLES|nr:hypothetical protein [Colocasia esculenta]